MLNNNAQRRKLASLRVTGYAAYVATYATHVIGVATQQVSSYLATQATQHDPKQGSTALIASATTGDTLLAPASQEKRL